MLRRFARWVGGIALHWFYDDIVVTGAERIPRDGPLLVAMNHQNALVDAILAMWIVPQDVRITAKATIASNIAGALLMRAFGMVPLRRSSDEGGMVDRKRNEQAFAAIDDALRRDETVLMFPEGRSHNEPGIAPLKTGLARAALRACATGIRGVRIVPISAAFADKAEPGSDVALAVGELIDVDAWAGSDPHVLTTALAEQLARAAELGAAALQVEEATRRSRGARRRGNVAMRIAAWWGDVTHRVPLRIARRWALAQGGDPDQPAMYTMVFGLALVLLFYLAVGILLWLVAGPLVALLVVASLVVGAHAAAYIER